MRKGAGPRKQAGREARPLEDGGKLVWVRRRERGTHRLNHLVVEIVTLAGALADAGKDGETTMALGDVVDELHDEDGLADTSTAEEANLSATGVGGKEVHDLPKTQRSKQLRPWFCRGLGEGCFKNKTEDAEIGKGKEALP